MASMTDDRTKQWYVPHLLRVRKQGQGVTRAAGRYGLQDEIGEILIPTEQVVEMRGGKKVVRSKRFFPGYILVEMHMSDNAWHVVKNRRRSPGSSAPARRRAATPAKRSTRSSAR